MLCSSLSYDHRRSSAIPDFGNSLASHVKCSGSGIDNAKANRHNSFSVDCSKAGNNILYVGVYGPETPCEEIGNDCLGVIVLVPFSWDHVAHLVHVAASLTQDERFAIVLHVHGLHLLFASRRIFFEEVGSHS